MKKLSKSVVLSAVRAAVEDGMMPIDGFTNEEVLAKVDSMIAALNTEHKPTAKQIAKKNENEANRKIVLDYLRFYSPKSIPEMVTEIPEFEGKSSQYMANILSYLVLNKAITKKTVKGRVYYSIVGIE